MRALVLCTLPALAGCAVSPLNVPIDPNVLRTDGVRPEEEQFLILDVGRGIKLPARIAVTTKGNGTLEVRGITVPVVDEHDDGAVFVGGLLTIRLVDVDGDEYRDL